MAVNVFESFIQTADSFRNEVNGSLYEWAFESLVHTIRSNADSLKLSLETCNNSVMALNVIYSLQNCAKHIILCLKYNAISTEQCLLDCCRL